MMLSRYLRDLFGLGFEPQFKSPAATPIVVPQVPHKLETPLPVPQPVIPHI